ncbi:MAG: pyrroline-5-carboxylate reductase [Candidatus Omnitrophota bacterium]
MFNFLRKKIGIIGFGNMGQALGERIKQEYAVLAFDKIKKIVSKNVRVASSPEELVKKSEVIILAVKPQDFESLLEEIRPFVKGKLIISIAAGKTAEYIRDKLGEGARIIRVMPNLPAQVGQGVSVLFKDKSATEKDLNLAWLLLRYVGIAEPVDQESIINAVTAVSGSGPAFFCQYIQDENNAGQMSNTFIEELTEAAREIGLDPQFARVLSERTVEGTLAMLKEKKLSCKDLIAMVASKGGTTQAGLDVLYAGGSLNGAVKAALRRADELGKRG